MILDRVVKAFTLSGLILAVNIAGQILSVPILMAHWSVRTYGAWVALTNLGSSVTLMNLGVQSYVVNQLILSTAHGRPEDGARLLGSALKIYGLFCLAALGAIAAGLCFLNLPSFVDVGELTRGESSGIVLAHALLAVYAILGGLLINLLRVGQQLPRQLAYGFVERVLILTIPIAAAIAGASPLAASWGMVAALCLWGTFALPEVFRRTPVRISPSAGALREGLQLVGPSLFFFGSALSSQLLTTGVTLVISSQAGSLAVATFATAMMMTNLLRLIVHQLVNVLSGEITLLHGRRELARLRGWYRFLWKGTLGVAVAAAILLFPFGPGIVRLWTRNRVQIDFELNAALTLYLVVHAAGILSMGFGLAMGRPRPIFFVQLGNAVLAIAMSVLLIRTLGLHGIAYGLLAIQTAGSAALTLMNCRWLDQDVWRFLRGTVGRGVPTFVLAAAGIAAAGDLETLPLAMMATALTLAGCLRLSWFTWLEAGERRWLRTGAREFIQRRELRFRPATV